MKLYQNTDRMLLKAFYNIVQMVKFD